MAAGAPSRAEKWWCIADLPPGCCKEIDAFTVSPPRDFCSRWGIGACHNNCGGWRSAACDGCEWSGGTDSGCEC